MLSHDGFFIDVKRDMQANGWENHKLGTALRLLLLDLGVQVLLCYRLQTRLNRHFLIGRLGARIIAYWAQLMTGCQVHSTAQLQGGIKIPHANGIIIGRDVVIKIGHLYLPAGDIRRR